MFYYESVFKVFNANPSVLVEWKIVPWYFLSKIGSFGISRKAVDSYILRLPVVVRSTASDTALENHRKSAVQSSQQKYSLLINKTIKTNKT